LEEIYREESGTSFGRKVIAFIALLLIGCLYSYEWMQIQETYRMNLLGWGMDTVLLVLWFWRVSFKYTLILYKDKHLKVITSGMFFIKRTYEVDLTRTESITDKYVKSFFRKTRISHYIHRYSSLDENPQRLLVFTEGKKNKLAGLIFKSSDKFLQQLRRQMPDKYIQL
jgi:hypothetical protein